jgi:hypothetical protein
VFRVAQDTVVEYAVGVTELKTEAEPEVVKVFVLFVDDTKSIFPQDGHAAFRGAGAGREGQKPQDTCETGDDPLPEPASNHSITQIHVCTDISVKKTPDIAR